MEETGFTLPQIQTVKTALEKSGVVLVCGASLSGKTHIIYSILSEISKFNKNIMTIESISKYKGITTKSALDYFGSLVFKNKVILTEFLADNMADLNKKLSYADFEMFKPLISCIIFIHDKNRLEVLDKNDLKKFINIE